MNLSRKIILMIVSSFIALVFIVAVTSDIILLNSYAKLEQEVLEDTVRKIQNEIEESFPELDASAKNYAEMLENYGPSSLSGLNHDSFYNHRIDLLAIFDATGNTIALQGADFHNRKLAAVGDPLRMRLTQASRACLKQGVLCQLTGYVTSGNVILQIAVRPLIGGRLLMVGRFLDREEIFRVAQLSHLDIEFHPFVTEKPDQFITAAADYLKTGKRFYSQTLNDGQIAGCILLHDIDEAPAILMKVTTQRLIYEQGKISVWYVLLALGLCSFILCSVILFFMRGTILKRLALLNANVRQISRSGNVHERLAVAGDDELSELASSINSMLSSLARSEEALKESEERYRELFERAPDSIMIMELDGDTAGSIVAANRAAAEQHGYTLDEMSRLNIFDLNTPETNLIAPEVLEQISRGEWITREVWHRKKDGSQFPIEIHAGLFNIKGRRYILGFDRDITLRKVAEESDHMYLEQISQLNLELSLQASNLAVANAELESFNYSVSHDIRGPLTRISGYCQLLLDDESLDNQTRTYVSRMYESSCWLDELISAMLDLSRLSRTSFTLQPVDVSAMIIDVMTEIRLSEPQRECELIVQPDVKVNGDAHLLKIIVTNLLNNAWKYSSRKPKTVIEFGVLDKAGQQIYFVRDEGAGFDMKNIDKLFRVFTRLHDASQFSGSGIGLATVQRAIARHGGKIWAEGVVGSGATFFFTLSPHSSNAPV